MLAKIDANDFFMEVSKGNVYGMSNIEILGHNPDVDAGTETVWYYGGARTLASTAAVLHISSSSASDTTQYVTVTGLDANYDVITATKLLAGQTETALDDTKSFLRVNSITLSAACAGDVYVYYDDTVTSGVPQTASKIQGMAQIGALYAPTAEYCVPRNKKGYIYSVEFESTGSGTAHAASVQLVVTPAGGSARTYVISRYTDPGSGQMSYQGDPIVLEPETDIKVTSTLAATGTDMVVKVRVGMVLETVTVAAVTTTLMNYSDWYTYMSAKTFSASKLILVPIYELTDILPTTFDLNTVIGPEITGITTSKVCKVATNTTINFDANMYTAGSGNTYLVTPPVGTKMILCVWKLTESTTPATKYVISPVNTLISLGKSYTKSISFAA